MYITYIYIYTYILIYTYKTTLRVIRRFGGGGRKGMERILGTITDRIT